MQRVNNLTAPGKEIGAQALGGAVATLIVLSFSWYFGSQPPAGLEGALAVLVGAGMAALRKRMQEKDNARGDTPCG